MKSIFLILLLSFCIQTGKGEIWCVEKKILSDSSRELKSEGKRYKLEESLYRKGSLNCNKIFVEEKRAIDSLSDLHRLTGKEREARLVSLGREMQLYRVLLKKYAVVLARVNENRLSKLVQTAYDLLKVGDVSGALRVYEPFFNLQKENFVIADIDALRRYTAFCIFSGEKRYWERALEIYRKIALSDKKSAEYKFLYAYALAEQNRRTEAIDVAKQALKLARRDTDKIRVWALLENLYESIGEKKKRDSYQKKLTRIFSRLQHNTGMDALFVDLIGMNLVLGNNDMPDSEGKILLLREEIDRCEMSPAFVTGFYNGDLADLYEMLVTRMLKRQMTGDAEPFIEKVISIREQLAKNNRMEYFALREWMECCFSWYVSLEQFDKALSLFRQWERVTSELREKYPLTFTDFYIQSLCFLGELYGREKDWLKELDYYRKVKEELKKLPDNFSDRKDLILSCEQMLTTFCYREKDVEAIQEIMPALLEHGKQLYESDLLNNVSLLARVCYLGAEIGAVTQNIENAFQYYKMAGDLYLLQGSSSYLNSNDYIRILTRLGMIHMYKKEWDTAKAYLIRALEEGKMNPRKSYSGDKLDMAEAWANLASVYMETKGIEEAMTCHKEALQIYDSLVQQDSIGYTSYKITTLFNMASASFMLNHERETASYLQEARRLAMEYSVMYSSVYEPYRIVADIYWGICQMKMGNERDGRAILSLALQKTDNYSTNPLIAYVLNLYRSGKILVR